MTKYKVGIVYRWLFGGFLWRASISKISVGANRDVVYKNIENIIQLKQQMKNCSTIIEVKILDMVENNGEADKVLEYWKNRTVQG